MRRPSTFIVKVQQALNKELARRREENPRASLRSLARRLDVSATTLSLVLAGKRTLSAAMARRLATRLGERSAAPASEQEPGEALRAWIDEGMTDWNRHDARAWAMRFALDAEMIDPSGEVLRGRRAVQRYYAEAFGGRFAQARINTRIDSVRWLKRSCALVDLTTSLENSRAHKQTHVHLVLLCERRRGHWQISASRPYTFGGSPL